MNTFRYLKKNKGFTVLNISGLAVGFACAILVFTHAFKELSYNSKIPDKERIFYLVQKSPDSPLGNTTISYALPPMLAALTLGFFGNIMSSTTHYSNGPAPLLFGSGYITQNKWWSLNFILGIVYFIIWFGVGSVWWKVIGIY